MRSENCENIGLFDKMYRLEQSRFEITEEVQTGTTSDGFKYVVDQDGKVAITEKTTPNDCAQPGNAVYNKWCGPAQI